MWPEDAHKDDTPLLKVKIDGISKSINAFLHIVKITETLK